MSHQTAVILVMLGMPLIYIVIDIVLALNGRDGDTYSEILRKWFKGMIWLYGLVAFAMGVILGHWAPG